MEEQQNAMKMIEGAFNNLTEAIKGMNISSPPPPLAFAGKGNVEDFFRAYENFCTKLYQQEYDNYLLALPNFVEGDAKAIVEAFGSGDNVDYETVKAKLIEIFKPKSLGTSPHVGLWSASRHRNESYVCFGIRLEALAGKINTTAGERKEIVKAKFISTLDPSLARQLSIRFGDDNTVSLQKLINLATMLDDGKPKPNANFIGAASPWPTSEVEVSQEPLEEDFLQIGAVGGTQAGSKSSFGNFQGKEKFGQNRGGNEQNRMGSGGQQQQGERRGGPGPVCFECKEPGHIKKQCPKLICNYCKRQGHKESRCFQKQGRQKQSEEKVASVCAFCGEGQHAFMHCRQFKAQFLTCNWCGSSEHKSHLCPTKPAGNLR